MAFKIEGKAKHPIFDFAKCCWSIHFEVLKLGKHAHSKQRKNTPTQTLQFHVKFTCMPCSFSIYRVYFSISDLVCSKIRKSSDAEKAEKLVKIYQLCRDEDDKQLKFTETVQFILFFKSIKFRYFLFCLIEKSNYR